MIDSNAYTVEFDDVDSELLELRTKYAEALEVIKLYADESYIDDQGHIPFDLDQGKLAREFLAKHKPENAVD